MFGQYIRDLRTKKGLTLTELGAALKIDSANLSKIENGKRDFDEKKLKLLASVFGLDLEVLKTEYFGEFFAQKVYDSNCSFDVFTVAEQKAKYLRKVKQVL